MARPPGRESRGSCTWRGAGAACRHPGPRSPKAASSRASCPDCDQRSQGERYPQALREVERGALRALERLKAAGTIGAFGAGVNQAEACERLMDMGPFDCFMLAGRYTLLEQGGLDAFLPRCSREGVSVIAAAPYTSGILVTGAVPGARYNYAPAAPGVLARVARIEEVARAHQVPLAAAALHRPAAGDAPLAGDRGREGRRPPDLSRAEPSEARPGGRFVHPRPPMG